MASQEQLQKQQGEFGLPRHLQFIINLMLALQTTYQNYKSTLQNIAQKIGDIEQETEEHK